MLYGRDYEEKVSPDEARSWLVEKKNEIQNKINSCIEMLGLDDESQLNYELDECVKALNECLTYINSIDRAEIEENENINQSEPDWDSQPGGHDYID